MNDVVLFFTGWVLASIASGFLVARCIPASADDVVSVHNGEGQ